MTDPRRAERERQAREFLARLPGVHDCGSMGSSHDEYLRDLCDLLKDIEAATLEEAAEIAGEHGCLSYHELCDCRRDIADEIIEAAQERRA